MLMLNFTYYLRSYKFIYLFRDKVLLSFPGRPWTHNLPASAFPVARIINTSQYWVKAYLQINNSRKNFQIPEDWEDTTFALLVLLFWSLSDPSGQKEFAKPSNLRGWKYLSDPLYATEERWFFYLNWATGSLLLSFISTTTQEVIWPSSSLQSVSTSGEGNI
jgi:hypothetical protein